MADKAWPRVRPQSETSSCPGCSHSQKAENTKQELVRLLCLPLLFCLDTLLIGHFRVGFLPRSSLEMTIPRGMCPRWLETHPKRQWTLSFSYLTKVKCKRLLSIPRSRSLCLDLRAQCPTKSAWGSIISSTAQILQDDRSSKRGCGVSQPPSER